MEEEHATCHSTLSTLCSVAARKPPEQVPLERKPKQT